MTRPTTRHATVAADHASGPAGSRRYGPGRAGDPIHATVQPTASDFCTRIARILSTSAGTAALLPLESAGCDDDCAVPAVYDRATGSWRHLTDLKQCQRPAAAPPGSDVRQ